MLRHVVAVCFAAIVTVFGSSHAQADNGYVYVAPSYQPVPPVYYDPFLVPVAPPAPYYVPAPYYSPVVLPPVAPVTVYPVPVSPAPTVVSPVPMAVYGGPVPTYYRPLGRRHRRPYGKIKIEIDDDEIEYKFKWRD